MFGSLGLIFIFFFIFNYFSFIFRRKRDFYIPSERSRGGRHWVSRLTLQMLLIRGPEAKPPQLVRLCAVTVTPNWISLVKIRALRRCEIRKSQIQSIFLLGHNLGWLFLPFCCNLDTTKWEMSDFFYVPQKFIKNGVFSFPYFSLLYFLLFIEGNESNQVWRNN